MTKNRCLALNAESIHQAAEKLLAGEVVVFPTETVYGLCVRYGDDRALAALRLIKGRDAAKPFQILISDRTQLMAVGAVVSAQAQRVLDVCWPGGLTAVLQAGENDTVGVRMPDFTPIRELIRAVGCPLVATSANPAGEAPALDSASAMNYFMDDERVAMVLDGGPCAAGVASTVVDLTKPEPVILREGGVSQQQILNAWTKGNS